MKKLLLMSLAAIFAISAANAVDMSNPMYRPAEKHFMSETTVGTGFDANVLQNQTRFKAYSAVENFAYGITDKFAIGVKASGSWDSTHDHEINKHQISFDYASIYGSYRVMDICAFKADIEAGVTRDFVINKGLTSYATDWVAGIKTGLVGKYMTIAGTVKIHDVDLGAKSYAMTEEEYISKKELQDHDVYYLETGVDAQVKATKNVNFIAGVHYDFDMSKKHGYFNMMERDNPLYGTAGVNVNLDSSKYVGVYGTYDVNHETTKKAWGMKVKFGIDF